MNKKGRPDSETVDLGEDRLMLAGTAARLFPVGGFSVSGTHGFRICGQPLRLLVIFEWMWDSGPALDVAEKKLDGNVETGGPGREGVHMWESLLTFVLVRIRYRACSSPPRVRRALVPTNGSAATDEIREIWG